MEYKSRMRARTRSTFSWRKPVLFLHLITLHCCVGFLASLKWTHAMCDTCRVTWAGKWKYHLGFDRPHLSLTFKYNGIVILVMESTHSTGRNKITYGVRHNVTREHDHWHETHASVCTDVRKWLVDVICLPPHGYTTNWIGLMHATLPIGYRYSAFVLSALLRQ